MPAFERGFKTWAERISLSFRNDLRLTETAPLSPDTLANYLDVRLWAPGDVKGLSQGQLDQLVNKDKSGWSAVTIRLGDSHVVISNPTHSPGRRSSDIMHEIGHIIAGHEPSKMVLSPDGQLAMRTFDQKQEDEADWLRGCLLLPRPALLQIRKARLSESQACTAYGVTSELLNYRLNVTGVNFQLQRLARRYRVAR